jgi:DNA invertase Pin-like site-specific DNA recombinase
MRIGYERVSTHDQSHRLQHDALTKAGCDQIFTETISGAAKERPQLDAALKFLRPTDTLVVWKFDRLARDITQLLKISADLETRGIGLLSLTENIDTSGPGGRLVFHIFGALAQFERDIIRERVRAGLSSARARGRLGGRPKRLTEQQIQVARTLIASEKHKFTDIANQIGVNRSTLYRAVKRSEKVKEAGKPDLI